jgi:hypothetical protein
MLQDRAEPRGALYLARWCRADGSAPRRAVGDAHGEVEAFEGAKNAERCGRVERKDREN